MNVRSRFGVLQLPIACFGLVVIALVANHLLNLPPSPPGSDGFVEGFVIIFLYAVGFAGFVLAALGLAIRPGENFGIRFNRWQRRLFVVAAVAAVLSLVAPLVAWPMLASTPFGTEVSVLTWLVLSAVAILALVAGLGWRVAEAVVRRVG